jgi:hypothetical protein
MDRLNWGSTAHASHGLVAIAPPSSREILRLHSRIAFASYEQEVGGSIDELGPRGEGLLKPHQFIG